MNYIETDLLQFFPNIVADRIPKTPATGLPKSSEDFLIGNEMLQEEIKRRRYRIMTTEEKQGREIHDIIPVQGKEESFSNEGSQYFPFHVEVPHYGLHNRPDAVVLFCLRGTPGAKTLIINFRDLLPHLQEGTESTLAKDLFQLRRGESFGGVDKAGRDRPQESTSILTEIENKLHVTLDLAEMRGKNPKAVDALKDIEKTISWKYKQLVQEIELTKGDMLFFDNKQLIHGRNNFSEQIRYDGSQRWLKRCYLKKL